MIAAPLLTLKPNTIINKQYALAMKSMDYWFKYGATCLQNCNAICAA